MLEPKLSLNPWGSLTSRTIDNQLTQRKSILQPHVNLTTAFWLCFLNLVSLPIAFGQEATSGNYEPPLFRHAAAEQLPALAPETQVRLLADDDFAPFSFLSSSGAPGGLSVELAMAACAELKVRCTVATLPFAGIMAALARGDGDVAIAGPRLDAATARQALATRPFFRTMGRFAVQTGNPLTSSDPLSLASKRIGVAANSAHARWLETYYASAEIVAFDDAQKAADALRTGNVDVLFGDNVQLIYWASGQSSGGCCRLLGGAYSDFGTFSRNLVFLVRAERPELRAAFDWGLDMAQKNGATSGILKAYLPLNPW